MRRGLKRFDVAEPGQHSVQGSAPAPMRRGLKQDCSGCAGCLVVESGSAPAPMRRGLKPRRGREIPLRDGEGERSRPDEKGIETEFAPTPCIATQSVSG